MLSRFCVNLPLDLVRRVDILVRERGYGSRSNYLRCLISEALGAADAVKATASTT